VVEEGQAGGVHKHDPVHEVDVVLGVEKGGGRKGREGWHECVLEPAF